MKKLSRKFDAKMEASKRNSTLVGSLRGANRVVQCNVSLIETIHHAPVLVSISRGRWFPFGEHCVAHGPMLLLRVLKLTLNVRYGLLKGTVPALGELSASTQRDKPRKENNPVRYLGDW